MTSIDDGEEGAHVVKKRQLLRPTRASTNTVVKSMSPNGRRNLLEKECEQGSANDGKIKIMKNEEAVELEGWPVSHNLSAS